ncbi:hypothetical protein B0H19DRAFT_1257557 [Mycena capillaripes]|nr:hypothetical protein B0H19DRAFT_1257557 [Mycena capillaripes]
MKTLLRAQCQYLPTVSFRKTPSDLDAHWNVCEALVAQVLLPLTSHQPTSIRWDFSLIALALFFRYRRRQRAAARGLTFEAQAACQINVFQLHPTQSLPPRQALTQNSPTSASSPPLPVSVSKAGRRQAHLARQMQAIRAEMDELVRLDPHMSAHHDAARRPHLDASGAHTAEQFAALQARIRKLDGQAT